MPPRDRQPGSPAATAHKTWLSPWPASFAAVLLAVSAFAIFRLADPTLPAAGPVLHGADLNGYFFPSASFLRSSILDGELPLWNPFQFAGSPFLATHAVAAAYPPMLLLSLAPPHVALTLAVLLHLLLLGAFTLAFARSAGLTAAGAASASLLYMFSHSTVAAVHNVAYLSTFAWLPAVLWGVQAVVRTPDRSRAAGLALAMAMSLLSGHAQASLYSLQVALLFGVVLLVQRGLKRETAKAFAWLAGAAVLGAMLAAVQLLPAAELASLGVRSINGMSVDLADPLNWRRVHEGDLWNLLLGRTTDFLHPPPFLFAAILLAVLPRGRRLVGISSFVLLLLAFDFARGRDGWVFPFYFQLPLGSIFRLPARSLFLVEFGSALLVGIALSNLLGGVSSRASLRLAAAAAVLVIGGHAYVRNPLPFRFDPLTAPGPLYEPDSLIRFAEDAARTQERLFIQHSLATRIARNFGTVHDVFVVPGYDPILPVRYKEFFGIPADAIWHGDLDVIDLGRFSRPWGTQDPRLLDLLSVRYYVNSLTATPPDRLNPYLTWRVGSQPLPTPGPPVHPRSGALPRSYIVHDILSVADDREALERVRSFAFDPQRQVVLTDEPEPHPQPAPVGAVESAEIVSYRRNSVDLDVRCASACIVVLTDLWFPGWEVTVDGEHREILRANFLLRAVPLPAGTHHVRFEYAPASFYTGLSLTMVALAVILGLLGTTIFQAWARRRGPASLPRPA